MPTTIDDRQRCPAGGPGCASRTRELHVDTGPMSAKVGYYTCPSCGWVSAPSTVPEASR